MRIISNLKMPDFVGIFHPIGIADLLCVNRQGQFVIVDLKTPVNIPLEAPDIYSDHRMIQLEMYALLFDILCEITGNHEYGIAYTAILYWNPEDNNTFESRGSCTLCEIERNPGINLKRINTLKSNLLDSLKLI